MALEIDPTRGLWWYAAHAFDHAPDDASLVPESLQQMIAKLALDLIPDEGLREPAPDDATMNIRSFTRGRWVSHSMFTLAFAIAGGTSNVQRNIIGEHVLGLPRDPRPAAG